MTITPLFDLRRIIPRWRDSTITLNTDELVLINPKKVNIREGWDLFQKKLSIWQANKEIEFAADVVSSGISQGFYNEALDAAEFLIQNAEDVPPHVLSIANSLINRTKWENDTHVELPKFEKIDRQTLRDNIHGLKRLLIDYPRNPLKWVDLARNYILLGQGEQAKGSMLKAIALAPDNRFVLRSAARLLVHLDSPEVAHKLLVNSEATKYDPWLLAAEIATASVAKVAPRLVRNGRDVLNRDKFPPYHLGELASALATLELSSGAIRKAKKLFQQSMITPTENSVAQSVWAKRELPSLDANPELFDIPRLYEASALAAFQELKWQETLDYSLKWYSDEPFSSRPAELGSFAASVGLENYSIAAELTRDALIANPYDLGLINNLAFALANLGKLDEAYAILNEAPLWNASEIIKIPLMATEGLINIRKGFMEKGKSLYLDAISSALKSKRKDLAPMAAIFFAREMLLAGEFTHSEAVSFAEQISKTISNPYVTWLLEKLKLIQSPA